jgi:pyruvate dehydrogenase phosphatase
MVVGLGAARAGIHAAGRRVWGVSGPWMCRRAGAVAQFRERGMSVRGDGGLRQGEGALGGAGRSTSAMAAEDQFRSGRRPRGGGWLLSRNAVLFIKGASAATFASTAVVAACADKGDGRRAAEGSLDTSVVSLSRVLGEPTTIEAPHASVCAVSSNTKCEDRLAVHSIGSGDQSEHYYAVFDGHGGWECAEFAHTILSASISSCLQQGKGESVEEEMEEAIACGFRKVEETWTHNLKNEWLRDPNYMTYGPPGTERLSSVGTCVLMAIVHKGTLFVANAGDSRAVIAQRGFGGVVKAQRVTVDLNAMNADEQDRLRREHEGEPDIVRCRGPYSCYVKGCLQPTYSLGDAYLKYAYFNNFPGRVVAPPYKPPYIKTVPQITARPLHNIQEGDMLILATDGIWDYLSDQNAVDLASRAVKRGSDPALAIVEATLELAAARFGITRQQLSQLPLGRQRRLIHDDASVIVVDLYSAMKESSLKGAGTAAAGPEAAQARARL